MERVGNTEVTENTLVISRRHPEYIACLRTWEFFLESYIGGDEYSAKHLFKYFKEGTEEFQQRIQRAYRENHSRRVVDLINSYIFKEQPTRTTEDKTLLKFIDNADGKGKTLTQFMRNVSQMSSVLGRIYIVADRIQQEEVTGTNADNIGSIPYLYYVLPQDVLDVSIGDDGKVRWALIREKYRYGDEDFFTADSVMKDRFRLWIGGSWQLYNHEGIQIDAGDTGLKSPPIIPVDHEEFSDYNGLSLIGDIAYLDRAIFNNWSRLDTIVCDQTFSQLIFPIEGILGEVLENKELQEQFMKLATNRVLLYSNQAQSKPEFISPDASQAEFILNMIVTQTKQLFASIGLQAEMATESKANNSGVSKAYDFDKLNKLLATKADSLEIAEAKIFEVIKQWQNIPSAEVFVDYPDEFDTKSLADEIGVAERLFLLEVSETLQKHLHMMIALKAMPRATAEERKKIEQEIDEAVKRKSEEMRLPEEVRAAKADVPFDSRSPHNPRSKTHVTNPKEADYPTPSRQQSKEKAQN